jgi:DNA-binding transcriptional regulator YiaG
MKGEKKETFVFKGFGFPIKLIDAPMKRIAGVWCLDIDMDALQEFVVKFLISKTSPLTKNELRFIRKSLSLTTTEFGDLFGVSHSAVVHWESGNRKVSPALELCIRLFVFDKLHPKDKEFRNLFKEIDLKKLSANLAKTIPLNIDVAEEDWKVAQ